MKDKLKRKKPKKEDEIVSKTMRKYKKGKLTSYGRKITSRDQAIAIALSKQRRGKF